jgi:hypothetical protein
VSRTLEQVKAAVRELVREASDVYHPFKPSEAPEAPEAG